MKNINRVAFAGVLGLLLSSGALYGQPAQDQNRPGGRGPGGGPPKEILEKYDLNHDGVLDEQEHAAIRADIESGKLQRPPGRGPGGPGGPGMGNGPTPGNHGGPAGGPGMRQQGPAGGTDRQGMPGAGRMGGPGGPPSAKAILQRFDKDGDGMLNEAELNAFIRTMPRPPGPPQGPPPQGGPPQDQPDQNGPLQGE